MNGTLIEIGCVRMDGGTQPRASIDRELVESYADAYLAAAKLPPVVIYFDGTDYWLADGFHRVAGAVRAGLEEIDAEVRQGTHRDAILHSVGANAEHGLRRSDADKRRAVETLLRDPEWSTWSDRAIADACKVSPTLVGKVRATVHVDSGPRTNAEIRTGRDGRAIDVSGIQNRPPPPLAPPPPPDPPPPEVTPNPTEGGGAPRTGTDGAPGEGAGVAPVGGPDPIAPPPPPAVQPDPPPPPPIAPPPPAPALITDPAVLAAALAALGAEDLTIALAQVPKKALRAAGRTVRKVADAYYTPPPLARLIVQDLDEVAGGLAGLRILEPSAGDCAFAGPALACGARVTVVDLRPEAECFARDGWEDQAVADFLTWEGGAFDVIIGNPPFKLSEAFIRHAMELLTPGGLCVFLLRLGFWCGRDRSDHLYQEHPVEDVRPVAPRPSFTGDGKTDGQEYGVFYFRKPGEGLIPLPVLFGQHVRWEPDDEQQAADGDDEAEAA